MDWKARYVRVCFVRGTLLERCGMFDLTEAPEYRLLRPPLVQAIGQVKFPVRARLATLEGIAPVQDRLNAFFPYMKQQQVQQVSLLVGPTGPPVAEGQSAQTWRFDDDAGWTLVISADSATLSVGADYGSFETFSVRLRAVLEALVNGAGMTRVDRLGVRFVNIAEVLPGEPDSWRDWFKPEVVGWTATEVLAQGTRLMTSITQSQLAAPPDGELSGPPVDIQAIIRHGYVPAKTMLPGVLTSPSENPAYLLDMDIFVDAPQPFDVDEMSRQLTMLHHQIDRFFYWSLAPAGRVHFELEERT